MNFKNKHFYLSLSLFCVFQFSCNKKDDSTNQNLIIGKWINEKSVSWITFAPNSITKDTTIAHIGVYSDFRTDNKLYFNSWDNNLSKFFYDTASYSIIGNNLYTSTRSVSLNVTIQTLTANQLVLYKKDTIPFSNGVFIERWSHFYK